MTRRTPPCLFILLRLYYLGHSLCSSWLSLAHRVDQSILRAPGGHQSGKKAIMPVENQLHVCCTYSMTCDASECGVETDWLPHLQVYTDLQGPIENVTSNLPPSNVADLHEGSYQCPHKRSTRSVLYDQVVLLPRHISWLHDGRVTLSRPVFCCVLRCLSSHARFRVRRLPVVRNPRSPITPRHSIDSCPRTARPSRRMSF